MDAYIFNRSALALLRDETDKGETWYVMRPTGKAQPVIEIPAEEMGVWTRWRLDLGRESEVEYLPDVLQDAAQKRLDAAVNESELLTCGRLMLDSKTREHIAEVMAREVQRLFKKSENVKFFKNTMYAAPLHPDFDATLAARRCSENGAPEVAQFFRDLKDAQPAINTISRAWELVADVAGVLPEAQLAYRDDLANRGVFSGLVDKWQATVRPGVGGVKNLQKPMQVFDRVIRLDRLRSSP